MEKIFDKDENYSEFLHEIKNRIKSTQIKAAVSVNRELIELYWELGEKIVKKQKKAVWGKGFLEQISKDLQKEFPDMKGFSHTNIKYMRQWYLFWNDENPNGQQAVDHLDEIKRFITQIPWGHNLLIMRKSQNRKEAFYYILNSPQKK